MRAKLGVGQRVGRGGATCGAIGSLGFTAAVILDNLIIMEMKIVWKCSCPNLALLSHVELATGNTSPAHLPVADSGP